MQTTSATWQSLWAAGARLEARATIGGTVYGGVAPVITRALMQSGPEIGNAAAASCALTLRGNPTIAKSAEVAVEMRLTDGTSTSEWLPAGTFYISRRARDRVAGVLALECYDALLKADAVWTPSTGSWPRAVSGVVGELAGLLNLSLDSRTAIPSGLTMNEPEAGATIRDALGTAAQLCGGNWTVTPAGALRLVPFAPTSPDAVTVAAVLGGVEAEPAGSVTGVRTTAEDSVFISGDETGLVLDVTLSAVEAASLAAEIVGESYRPYTLTSAVYDPAAELGDAVTYGSEVSGILCAETASLGPAFRGTISSPEPGEVSDEYPYIGKADRALTVAKAYARDAVEALDDDLTQQEIFNRLTDNGVAQGLVLYNGQLYVNATYIHSGKLTLGGMNNDNGEMEVLDASGNVVGSWNNNGITLNKGSVVFAVGSNANNVISINGIDDIPSFRRAFMVKYTASGSNPVHTILDRGQMRITRYDGVGQYSKDVIIQPGVINLDVGNGSGDVEVNLTGYADYEANGVSGTIYTNLTKLLMDNGRIRMTYPDPSTYQDVTWFDLDVFDQTMDVAGTVTANGFVGDLTGNAATATKATQDGNGATISSTYLKLSGGAMTGNINMGQSGASSAAPGLQWKTEDGTTYVIHPYNNIFQLVSYDGTNWHNVLGFNSNGSIATEYPSQFRAAINAASTTDVSARIYTARGNIVKSGSTGTAVGYGKAVVAIFGKTVKVEFEAKITTAGTLSNVYDIGIGVANLKSINSDVPDFTVLNGGIIHYYTSAGALNTSMEGYAGEGTVNTTTNRWIFGRLYNTSGNVGAWPDSQFTAGMFITGTLYGELN